MGEKKTVNKVTYYVLEAEWLTKEEMLIQWNLWYKKSNKQKISPK